jgi:parvulin-like peptidyl-prolyl isomerase
MFGVVVWAQAPAPAAKPAAPKPAVSKPSAPAATKAAPPVAAASPVVFEAAGKKMTQAEFDEFFASLPAQAKQQLGDGPAGRRKVAEQMAELMTLAAEAERLKLDQKASVHWQIQIQAISVLANALYQHMSETIKPDPAKVQAWYDSHKGDYETVKARHILIRVQGSAVPLKAGQKDLSDAEALARAQSIRERLLKGESFEALAKEFSDDTGSGAQGGDLGSFGHGRMVPVFEQAAFSLPEGEVSQPVKSQFGYHLIRVDQHAVKPLDGVRAEIEKRLQAEAAQQALEALKGQARPALDEQYFGKPPAAVKPAADTPAAK